MKKHISVLLFLFIHFLYAKEKDTLLVAQDGTGDYNTIQKAINETQAYPYQKKTIYIKNGLYHEKVKLHAWNPNLTIIGESKENTVIKYNDSFTSINLGRNSTFHTATFLVDANDVVIKNITIKNTAGQVGQAIALAINASRVAVINCAIIGNQDTLFADGQGKQLYQNCYIEGTTDFIFGNATAWFEDCIIHSKENSYITAASTTAQQQYGFVFYHCNLTGSPSLKGVYLGRPWRIYAKTVFLKCNLESHIIAEGWHDWNKPEAHQFTHFAEYQNTGSGSAVDKRVKWSKQLTKKQFKKYTKKRILTHDYNWYEIDTK